MDVVESSDGIKVLPEGKVTKPNLLQWVQKVYAGRKVYAATLV
jgi:hypothetical protein